MNKKCLECVTYRATERQCDEYAECPYAKYGGYAHKPWMKRRPRFSSRGRVLGGTQ